MIVGDDIFTYTNDDRFRLFLMWILLFNSALIKFANKIYNKVYVWFRITER